MAGHPFDPTRYEDDVLKPRRRTVGRHPTDKDDLLVVYAVDPAMDAVELRTRIETVRRLWSRLAGGLGRIADVCEELRRADADRRREVGDQLYDPAWWRSQLAERDQAATEGVRWLAGLLGDQYGRLGVVTAGLVDDLDRTSGLDAAGRTRAVAAAGLRLVEPVKLPSATDLDPDQRALLADRLARGGLPTVVHALYPEPAAFGLIPEFRLPGRPGARLDEAAVGDRIAEIETEASSPSVIAVREVLYLLSALSRTTDLRTVTLALLVERLRASGVWPPAVLAREAERCGLVNEDAGLLAISVLAIPAPTPEPDPVVREPAAKEPEPVVAAPVPDVSPVRDLIARRHGAEALVTWAWPSGIASATVRWWAGTAGGTDQLTRARYERQNGLRLPIGDPAAVIEVAAEAPGVQLDPVRTTIVPRPPRLRCALVHRRRLAVLSRPVAIELSVAGGVLPSEPISVAVVVAPDALPASPVHGVRVGGGWVQLAGSAPARLELHFPVGMSGVHWLRCFVLHPPGISVTGPSIASARIRP